MKEIIRQLEKEKMLKKKVPEFKVGDLVRVSTRIVEGDKERLTPFEGIVIKRQGGGIRETFTIRRLVQGIGVERTFPIYSPKVESVKVVKSGKVRRAKLYYLRKKIGAAASKIEERETV